MEYHEECYVPVMQVKGEHNFYQIIALSLDKLVPQEISIPLHVMCINNVGYLFSSYMSLLHTTFNTKIKQ